MEEDYSKYLVQPEDIASVDGNNLTTADKIAADKEPPMSPEQIRAARALQGDILKELLLP